MDKEIFGNPSGNLFISIWDWLDITNHCGGSSLVWGPTMTRCWTVERFRSPRQLSPKAEKGRSPGSPEWLISLISLTRKKWDCTPFSLCITDFLHFLFNFFRVLHFQSPYSPDFFFISLTRRERIAHCFHFALPIFLISCLFFPLCFALQGYILFSFHVPSTEASP